MTLLSCFKRGLLPQLCCLFALGCFCIAGCGASTENAGSADTASHDDHDHDHDHDHDFANLGEAFEEIDELSNEIMTAFTGGEPESAHDALHHIGEVLEATEMTVSKSELSEEAKASAMKAVESLFDSFTAIDETMHGETEDGSDVSAMDENKSSIMEALETLKTLSAE